jgi:hypothetical protein
MALSARGMLILSLVGFGGAARRFFCFLLDGLDEGFVGHSVSSFPFSGDASVWCLSLLLCERVGLLVIPGGCFGCGAAGGGTCLFWSQVPREAAVDLRSPPFLAASVTDFRSTSSIRLDGCSGRWLLWRFQGLEPICRTGGGLLLAPMHVGVGGGRERGHRKKEVDLVVILLSFRVRDAKWGCTVHCY